MGGVVSAIGNVVGSVGGLISGGKAADAAKGQAEALRAAGDRASQMAMFRPVGITTGFGRSRFDVDPLGRVTEAGYELTPELQAIRNRLLGSAGQYQYDISGPLTPISSAAQGLFGLGGQLLPTDITRAASPEALALQQRYQQAMEGLVPTSLQAQASPETQAAAQLYQRYASMLAPTSVEAQASPEAQAYAAQLQGISGQLIPTSLQAQASPEAMALSQQLRGLSQQVTPTSYDPTAAAQQYFEQQRALLEPSRQAQLSQTRSRLFGTGRGGLGVTTATGGAPTSPELQAYYNAIAQQDRELAAQSTDVARQRLAQDIGLGTQLGTQALATQTGAEQLARQNLLQNLGLGTQFAGQAFETTTAAQQLARQNLLQNLGLTTGLTGQAATATEASRQQAEQNLLNRLGLGLGFGREAIATGLAGEDVARQRFAQDLALGTGLFGTAGQFLGQVPALQSAYLEPLRAQLGLAGTVESLGQQPFLLSQELAAAQAGAGRGAAAAYLQPQQAAANAYAQYQGYSPMGSFLSGVGGGMGGGGGLFGSLSGLFGGGSQGGYNFGAVGRQFGIPGRTSTGLYTFD